MHSLYIFPEDPATAPLSIRQLQTLLKTSGLVGEPLDEKAFLAGPRFFQLLVFAGCSPSMRIVPDRDSDDPLVHIRLLGVFPAPRWFVSRQYSRPRCPECQRRIRDWRKPERLRVRCPGCGTESPLTRLNWRKDAASGRTLIEVRNVFPGEALPTDELLQLLHGKSGSPWRYGWAANSGAPENAPGEPLLQSVKAEW